MPGPGRFVSHRPWYFSTGYGLNKAKYAAVTSPVQGFRNNVDRRLLGQFWAGQTNGGFQPGDADKRQLFKVGVGYQLTPQLNLGAHYFRGKQSGSVNGGVQWQRQLLCRRGGLCIQQAHRRLLWRGPPASAGGALVLDAVSKRPQPYRYHHGYSSPLLITGGEKRRSGNRVAQVSRENRVASDSDPVFSFGKIRISRAAQNQRIRPQPEWARDEAFFRCLQRRDGWHCSCMQGVKGPCHFRQCVLENHRSLPETSC